MTPSNSRSIPRQQTPSEPLTGGGLFSGPAIVLYIAVAKLLLHLFTAYRYGIFRDEMLYVACSEHLAWGYVDHPPLVVGIAWIAHHLFGNSPLGLRLFPALAGAALVWLTGKLVREMGGGRFAQGVAALAVLVVPLYQIMHHWLTMNAFEPLIWMGCIWLLLRVINTGDAKYWLWFGVLAGLGFETKYSIVFLLLGLLAGVVFTPARRFLLSWQLWVGVLCCALIALPNLLWQIHNHFPFLELMHNVRMGNRDVIRGPIAFLLDQIAIMNPILAPLWLAGLVWLLFSKTAARYRALGWTYIVLLAVFIALKGKNYYLAPVYPMLFAAGAIVFERLTTVGRLPGWSKQLYVALLILVGVVLAPLTMPLLSPEGFLRYQALLHIQPPKAENQNNGPLPQYFADEFGWEEMVQKVAHAYNSLPPEERARTGIFANSWGQAVAIDFYGPKYGLPHAISPQNNYWIWGPGKYDGNSLIVLGSNGQGDRDHFQSVEPAGVVDHPYSRRDEHYTIWICRGLKGNLRELWPALKDFS
jgi:dolichyl-phosphate-mannose-protein mannosyltransferase